MWMVGRSHDVVTEPNDSHVGVGLVHCIQNRAHGAHHIVKQFGPAFLCRPTSRRTCW